MYAVQSFLFGGCSDDPLIRFGIKHPDGQSLKVLSCIFSAYHALKGDIRSGRINVQLHSSVWLNASWSVFANAIKAEAMEMQLVTKSCSLPQFIHFLLNGKASRPAICAGPAGAQDPH